MRQLCHSLTPPIEGVDELPDSKAILLIKNNRLPSSTAPPFTIPDPFEVSVQPLINPDPDESETPLDRAKNELFPGLYRIQADLTRHYTVADAEGRELICRRGYQSIQKLFESHGGNPVPGVPDNLVKMSAKAKRHSRQVADLRRKNSYLYRDMQSYLDLENDSNVSYISQLVRKMCWAGKSCVGLISTQISAFVLGLFSAWGLVLGDGGPIKLNIIFLGPQASGKSTMMEKIGTHSGVIVTSQVMSTAKAGFYNTGNHLSLNVSDESPICNGDKNDPALNADGRAFQKTNLEANASEMKTVDDGVLKGNKKGKVQGTRTSIDQSLKLMNANHPIADTLPMKPIIDRCQYVLVPGATEATIFNGQDEMSAASARDTSEEEKSVKLAHHELAAISFFTSSVEHLVSRPPVDTLVFELWDKIMNAGGAKVKLNRRAKERHIQLATAIQKVTAIAECAQPWPQPDGSMKVLSREDQALAVFANSLVLAPESVVLAYFLLIADISSIDWKVPVKNYVFGELLQPVYEGDLSTDGGQGGVGSVAAAAAEQIVSFQRAPEGGFFSTERNVGKLSKRASDYLDRIPGVFNPGPEQIGTFLSSLQGSEAGSRAVTMSQIARKVGTSFREEERVVLNDEYVNSTLTPVQCAIIKVAYRTWLGIPESQRMFTREGMAVLPYTTLPGATESDFVSEVNKRGIRDGSIFEDAPAIVGREGVAVRIEGLVKKLTTIPTTQQKVGLSYYTKLVKILETKKRNGRPFLQFVRSSKITVYTDLPDTPTGRAHKEAKDHPFISGRKVLQHSTYALVINPAAYELAIESAEEDFTPDFKERLLQFYQCTTAGSLEDQRADWETVRFPVGIRTNRPRKSYVDVAAADPDTLDPIEVPDPNFRPPDADTFEWRPRETIKATSSKTSVRNKIFKGRSPTVVLRPGMEIYAAKFVEHYGKYGFGLNLVLPSMRHHFTESE